jgi:hypothetical protein
LKRTLRSLIGSLSLAAIAVAPAPVAHSAQSPEPRNLILFPIGLSESAFSPDGISLEEAMSKEFEAAMRKDKRFRITPFSRAHSSIKRALTEGAIPAALLLAPFTGRANSEFKALTLARLMRGELTCAATIDRFRFDGNKGQGEMVLTIEMCDVKAGKLIGSVALTAVGKGATEIEAAKATVTQAVADAVPQAVAVLTAPPKTGGL